MYTSQAIAGAVACMTAAQTGVQTGIDSDRSGFWFPRLRNTGMTPAVVVCMQLHLLVWLLVPSLPIWTKPGTAAECAHMLPMLAQLP
jgi:hypothetical protein